MTDIDKKLTKMEEQLDAITSSLHNPAPRFLSEAHPDSRFSAASRSDEIDLRELFGILWQGKWWIIGITFLFAVAGVAYALSLPNMYKSEGIYAPEEKDKAGGGMSGQFGGLAAMAGVNLSGGESTDIDQAIALITSWPFLEEVVNKNNLAPYILAIKKWNKISNKIVWNTEVYDFANSQWKVKDPDEQPEPTSYEIFHALSKLVEVTVDAKNGMVKISVTHYSPEIAEAWVRLLVQAINSHFQRRDNIDAQLKIEYLKNKIADTAIAEMQAVFYDMIESQMQTLMLAEVGDEYLFREVVPPKVAERKSKPAKALICFLFVFFGGILSCLGVLFRGA